MRILAVDHGEKRIGLALSDASGALARPLAVRPHVSRRMDAAAVAGVAAEHGVGLIVVGQSLNDAGQPNLAGRRAARFAAALRAQTRVVVVLWDESLSTRDGRDMQRTLGVGREKRRGHADDLAAAVILQSYLDAQRTS